MTILELLSDQKKWTRGAYARTEDDVPCPVEEGSCFCLEGAIRLLYPVEKRLNVRLKIYEMIRIFHPKWNGQTITSFNDTVHYETVLDVVDRAKV